MIWSDLGSGQFPSKRSLRDVLSFDQVCFVSCRKRVEQLFARAVKVFLGVYHVFLVVGARILCRMGARIA